MTLKIVPYLVDIHVRMLYVINVLLIVFVLNKSIEHTIEQNAWHQ
jgi:hypothetical protein